MKAKYIAIASLLLALTYVNLCSPIEAAKHYAVVDEQSNRSLVPIRYVAETFGYEVNWDGKTKTAQISLDDQYVKLIENSNIAIVNGEQIKIDIAPFTLNSSMYVPLRFVTEQLGTEVNIDGKNNIILKNSKLETSLEMVNLKRYQQALSLPLTKTTSTQKIGSSTVSINIIYIDLYNPNLSLDVYYANNKIGTDELFKDMVNKTKAKAAVNGTFFNAYSKTEEKIPYGYIVKDGQMIHRAPTEKRSIFVYTTNFEPKIVTVNEFHTLYDEGKVSTAIQAGPMLVRDSKVVVDAAAEGFKDPKILTNRGARSVIGVTAQNKLLIATTNATTIPDLAEAMLNLDVVSAMNLDGGASSALYAEGDYITEAGRELSNILTIHY